MCRGGDLRTSPAGLWSHGYAKPRRWAARCPAILDPGMTGLTCLAKRQSTDALASYDLKEALQSLAKILVDYHVRS